MKDKMTSHEFQKAIKEGELDISDGKLVTGKHSVADEPKKVKKRKPTPIMDKTVILNNIKKYAEQSKLYIPFDVRSSKNSQIIRHHSMQKSIAVREYVILSWPWWNLQTSLFKKLTKGKEYPLSIGFYWIRGTDQTWDYLNLAQLPCDIMNGQISLDSVMEVKKEKRCGLNWIIDDDVKHIKPIFDGYEIDNDNRGLVITVY